ncbi:ABC transporter substrate-binding protein [uncultured Friedmanniella sp.]|uniref:ABC transporter substrate-binding protein n=1 Tax=uncultured Friedmanniella sp. TaxID=335381 RepID=UPI0035CB471A
MTLLHTAGQRRRGWTIRTAVTLVTAALSISAVTACSGGAGNVGSGGDGGGGGGSESKTINVLAVNNPQMLDAQKITDKYFTQKTGITVNYTMLPENEERDKATQDVANSAGQYDVTNLGPYEVPVWSKNKWLTDLSELAAKDPGYDIDDLVPSVRDAMSSDGTLYSAPFATESTFTAYRKDWFDEQGLTMPDNPTWPQILDLAKKLNDPSKKRAGVCVRGLAGWGQNMALFTDMLNTFGGTWFNQDWSSGVKDPAFRETMEFYKEIAKYGPKGQASLSVSDCYNNYIAGTSAMWIDSSAAGPSIEDPKESKAAGKTGYAYMPVVKTEYSGWLWSWGWAIPQAAKNKDAAWQYISWVTGKQYPQDMAQELGWSHYAGYMRKSVDQDPGFVAANDAFTKITSGSLEHADPNNPGLQPRPYAGIQYLTIPEWPDLGTTAGQQLQAVLAGTKSVDQAIDTIAAAADKVSSAHQ